MPEAEAALHVALAAAQQRRAEAQKERDGLLAQVEPLRALVPSQSADELLVQLRTESVRRQELDAEFALVKGRISELAVRIGRLRQPPYARPAMRPAELRWRAGQLGETYVPPAEMKAALEYVGRSAAALSQTLHVPPLDHEQQHNVQDGEHL